MQLYVADYLADTQHLSLEQNGAYFLLLMAMWRAGGSLPNDEVKLRRIAKATARQWSRIRDDVMAFFDEADGAITQKRLTKELQKAASKSQSRAAAGSLGGMAKSLKDKEQALAKATSLPQHSSDIRNHIGKRDTNVSPKKPTPFEELSLVLDEERARSVVDHRQRIRKPLTSQAAKLLAGKMGKCADPNAAADAMVSNGWQGFEPEWMDRVNARGSPPQKQTMSSVLTNLISEMETANDIRPSQSSLGFEPAVLNLPTPSRQRDT